MMELLTSPEAWAALLTLTALEIVLGIDNVIFLSVIVSRIPPQQAERARKIGLALALVFRVALLSVLVWLIGLTQPVFTVGKFELSWRDIILLGGGLFLIAKATHEIHAEVEARDEEGDDTAEGQRILLGDRPDHRYRSGVLAGFDHHRDRHGAGSGNHDRRCRDRRGRDVRIVQAGGRVRGRASDHVRPTSIAPSFPETPTAGIAPSAPSVPLNSAAVLL